MELKRKVALIAGGTRMGLAIGQALGRHGCHVIVSYRSSREAAEETVSRLRSEDITAEVIQADLQNTRSVSKMIRIIEKRWKRLDVVVNLASIYENSSFRNDSDYRLFQKHMTAHAEAVFILTSAVVALMNKNGGGRMIHFTDWLVASGRPRYKNFVGYYASKAAVKGLVEILALELAPTILVNAIAPGPILPPAGLSRKELKKVSDATPLGRWGGAEEIAKTVAFLCETDFITGETIRVDGGRHLS